MGARLDDFCRDNPLVRLDDAGRLHVADRALFVFGGDAVDRGPDARRVMRVLFDAEARQPDRVVLLAGNRDLNKMRLRAELGADPRPEHLRTIFERTMGARAAFDHRRAELARERRVPAAAVNDDAVVESYVEETRPGGATAAYLARCRLAFRWGRTLFVHGGVSEDNLGFVPGLPTGSPEDVDGWIAHLDAFYAEQIAAFDAGAPTADYEALVDYQRPSPGARVNAKSVVYMRTADDDNNLELPPERACDALVRAGVANVVVGHTPNGDSPSLARDAERGFTVLVADNSYARVPDASRVVVDRRGVLDVDAPVLLDDGTPERVRFRHDPAGRDTPLGLRLSAEAGGWLVKGELSSGDWLLYRTRPGYVVEQRAMSLAALRAAPLVRARRA